MPRTYEASAHPCLSGLCGEPTVKEEVDVILVGGGIMSATLTVLLHKLDPSLRLLLVERLEGPARESSAAVNNAGTGHAANCELNYTPLQADGTVATSKAVAINASGRSKSKSLSFMAPL